MKPVQRHFEKIISASLQEFTPFFQSGDSVIFNADCLEILCSIPENSIDMIFADPPYMLSNGGFTCKNGKMANVNKGKWDKSNGFEVAIFFGYYTKLFEINKTLLILIFSIPGGIIFVLTQKITRKIFMK